MSKEDLLHTHISFRFTSLSNCIVCCASFFWPIKVPWRAIHQANYAENWFKWQFSSMHCLALRLGSHFCMVYWEIPSQTWFLFVKLPSGKEFICNWAGKKLCATSGDFFYSFEKFMVAGQGVSLWGAAFERNTEIGFFKNSPR